MDSISKPSFLLKGEKEKEVFLNGEVKEVKKVQLGNNVSKTIKKTMVCMKALQVEEYLGREAIRNVMNKESSFKFVSTNNSNNGGL
jgi:hypothetical protein